MPALDRKAAQELLGRRAPEWQDHRIIWQWLSDSLEGGSAYRNAEYGSEAYSWQQARLRADSTPWLDPESGAPLTIGRTAQFPRRNLLRHRREYPTNQRPDSGPAEFTSTDDPYELRRARTPVPTFVPEAVSIHLGRIYAREVKRTAPTNSPIHGWWADADGRGTPIDDWMRETVAPLFAVLGQIDLLFDHPAGPDGEPVETRADVDRLGLGACIASIILPENLIWWRLDPAGKRYVECLVVEAWSQNQPTILRHWTAEDSVLYDADGTPVRATPHPFGRVPIVRCFDVRKPRCRNVGQSRYEGVAEIQREYYNVSSELVLNLTFQSAALLSGPEDFIQGEAISTGPDYVLPKKKTSSGGYEGWEFVSPPSSPSDNLRNRLRDLRDDADRAACLTKPAGAAGTGGQTVSQSGVSKMMDASTGNDLLAQESHALRRLETTAAEFVLAVLTDGEATDADLADVSIGYPMTFDLRGPAELGAIIEQFVKVAGGATGLPETSGALLRQLVRSALPGLDDEDYAAFDAEIAAKLAGPPEPDAARDEDQRWRVEAGLASVTEILMERERITRDEAHLRLAEIAEDRELEAELLADVQAPGGTDEAGMDEAGTATDQADLGSGSPAPDDLSGTAA